MLQTDGIQDGEETFNSIIKSAKECGIITDDNTESIQKILDLLVEWGILQDKISVPKLNDSPSLTSTDALSNVQSLSEGLSQLSSIFEDISDKGDFDWSSILNNDSFHTAFGSIEDATGNYRK